jgi:hypothetical protein
MNKPYVLKHPLYPHPKALEYISKIDKKMQYEPHAGSFDFRYNQWYQACRVDIDEGLADDRELIHFVTAVYRVRTIDGDKIYYKEYIQGKDKDGIVHTFDHFEGMFEVLQIDRYFNYQTGKPANRYTGNTEKKYYIDFTPEKILELAELAPSGKQQNYYIIGQGGQKLTKDIFFNAQTMAGLDFDELYEVATAPLLSDTIRSKMRKVQQDIGPIKVKMSSKA